jgi:three-Cys-motif partner protein
MATKNLIPAAYEGREQAFIKHNVLEKYLEKLTAILAVNRRSDFEFTYVDCFAGPWQADTTQMHSTSIAISLRVLDKCKKTIEKNGGRAVIRALFVEESDDAYPHLEKYLSENTPSGISAHSIHGEFVASRQKILDWVGSRGYAFFFIDPKGWTEVKVNTLTPLLVRSRSEFVINFMYDFINRTASMEQMAPEMEALIGEPVADLMNEGNREASLSSAYRKNLKKQLPNNNGNYPARSAYVKILDPRKNRTKYHLIYVTTHPKGIIKFMETIEAVDELQDLVRAKIRDNKMVQKSGMLDLFAEDEPFVDDSSLKANEPIVDEFWLRYVGTERRIDEAGFADILEETHWFPSELQASLSRLILKKKIQNLDAPKPRPKKPLHFEERGGERLRVLL